MQKSTIKGLAVSALFLGMFAAAQTASAAAEGIRNTRHNLGSGTLAVGASTGVRGNGLAGQSGLGDVFTTATSEICVFCHTPHGANTSVPVPLWNKGSLASTVYQTFNSGTMNSQAPANLVGHMSLACLSCHDGTQAMDNMVNQPGQGGYTAAGARLGTDVKTGSTAGVGVWYAGNNDLAQSDGPDCSSGNADVCAGKLLPTAGIDFIGTDLSNDHPIGMAYGGGNCTVNVGGSCSDPDFNAAKNGLNGWFEVGGFAAGSKNNMRLYGQTLASATVECASCHDPHTDAQNTFLRVSNSGSGVCLTCHAK